MLLAPLGWVAGLGSCCTLLLTHRQEGREWEGLLCNSEAQGLTQSPRREQEPAGGSKPRASQDGSHQGRPTRAGAGGCR